MLPNSKHKDIFKTLFEAAGEGLVLVDGRGQIIMVNPRIKELFFYEESELLGQSIDILIPSTLRDRHKDHRASFMAKPKKRSMGAGMDLLAQRKDGGTFPVEVSLTHFTEGGEVFVMGLITDITERKNTERRVQEMNLELERRVEERTKELADVIRELEYSNRNLEKAEQEIKHTLDRERELSELKSRFVSTASHEFRTPLATILSSVILIEKYTESSDQEKRERHSMRIRSAVGNLTSILNEFLSIEKIEEGKVLNNPQLIIIDSFVNQLVQEAQLICKSGQEIRSEITCKNQKFNVDPALLKNSLLNLLSNAIKFSAEHSLIRINVRWDTAFLVIDVIDQGIGIAVEDQEFLFGRFFRAKNAVSVEGTGLGLHIIKSYVRLMGGEINLQSTLDVGSTFTIRLPMSPTK